MYGSLIAEGKTKMRASFIDVDGIRTRYFHEGDSDETLLLVHGFGLSSDIWAHVFDALAEHFTVYAPDILGHGFTDFQDPGEEAAPLVMARHLARFMDAVGIERCAALGSSLGALLVPLLYAARPEQITALIIDGLHTPVADGGRLPPDGIKAVMANGRKAMTNVTWQSCIDRMAQICHDPARSPVDIALMQVTIYAQEDRLSSYLAYGQNMIDHGDDDAVRMRPETIEAPTLFISGRQDIRAPIEIIEKNYTRIAGAQLSVFEECGHLPEVEYPEKFVETVTAFLRK